MSAARHSWALAWPTSFARNPKRPPTRLQSQGPGFGRARSVILIYLQGGPSHLDLWDPKDNVPERVRSTFSTINTVLPGVRFTELLPRLAQVIDKTTLIRTMSYTPVGLFNHTAAIYQMLTGYQADAVSPSGQLEPPTPRDFPNFGCNIARLKPPTQPTLPFVMMPRPLQESNVVGKGGTAGFLGRAYDPYYLYPSGDDMDMSKMDRVSVDDLQLRPEVSAHRLERRGQLARADRRMACPTSNAPSPATICRATTAPRSTWFFRAGRGWPSTSIKKPAPCASAMAATRSANAACWPGA